MAREAMKTSDPAAQQVLKWANENHLDTAFERAEKNKPCPVGGAGACCNLCQMGPCRIVGQDSEQEKRGICGATLPVIVARNFARMCAAGASAHADHARDMALTLLSVARGETKDFCIKDEQKLYMVAEDLGIDKKWRKKKLAEEVALKLIEQFGQQNEAIICHARVPEERQKIWRLKDVYPRGVEREIVETMHRTNMGVDQDPETLLMAAARVSLADGWCGSMFSTEISDILFGTPSPKKGKIGLGLFEEDHVNLVVHGHEPSLSEMIVDVHDSPEIMEYAKNKGAKGLNLVGMCCTANEVMMRHGIPSVGGFLHQELGILSGLVEAIVVDVQCIMPAIVPMAKNFHTEVITTNQKGRLSGATHIEYNTLQARNIAKKICKMAIDNYSNRTTKGSRVHAFTDCITGFSRESLSAMGEGNFKPFIDAILEGSIRGIVGVVGCNNPRQTHNFLHNFIVKECIINDILVLQTGCSAAASGQAGMMTSEAAHDIAGPGLKALCATLDIPPVLHLGSCVDNSRILTIASQISKESGLKDIGGLPLVGIAPEWMSEKAIAIGMYFMASGVPVVFGGERSPISASSIVKDIMENKFLDIFHSGLYFESDPMKILNMTIEMIDRARKNLGIKRYDRGELTKNNWKSKPETSIQK